MIDSYKGFVFRLKPTPEQEQILKQMAGNVRFVWNYLLDMNMKHYEKTKQFIFRYDMQKMLPQLKEEFEFLKESHSSSLQYVCQILEKALLDCARSGKGFPKFKKRGNESIYFTNAMRVPWKRSAVKIPKVGYVPWVKHRATEGRPLSYTVTYDGDQWHISVRCKINKTVIEATDWDNIVGVDFGISSFLVLSNGDEYDYPRELYRMQDKLAKLERRKSRKKLGSSNRRKAIIKVKRLHRKIKNRRKYFFHQLANELVAKYGGFVVENFPIREMTMKSRRDKKHKLNLAVYDAGWYSFKIILEQKCIAAGKYFSKAHKYAPTNRRCLGCGHVKDDPIPLWQRTYKCDNCEYTEYRPLNSARNVLRYDKQYCEKKGLEFLEVQTKE